LWDILFEWGRYLQNELVAVMLALKIGYTAPAERELLTTDRPECLPASSYGLSVGLMKILHGSRKQRSRSACLFLTNFKEIRFHRQEA
jgi:hypothetical protein